MTTSSAPAEAASNGGDTATKKDVPAQRVHGVERLREDECYHLTSLILDCLREAEHLVRKVYSKAQNRTLDHDGSRGTKPLDRDELVATLNEAYDCGSQALSYLYSAAAHLKDQTQPTEDAWVSGSLY